MSECVECEPEEPEVPKPEVPVKKYPFYDNLLKNYNIDREELKKYDWVGGYYACIDDEIPLIDTAEAERQYIRFKTIFPGHDFPKHKTQCVCETTIVNNAYIAKNEDYNTIIVVGCRCIRKFVCKMINTRKCTNCGEKHKCKTELCTKCKKLNKKNKSV